MALKSVITYLEGALDPRPEGAVRMLLPLQRLLHDLEDLEIGLVDPLLKPPVRRSGGSKLTRVQAEFRLLVCIAVQMLVGAGTKQPLARKEIAGRLRKAKFHRQRRKAGEHRAEIDDHTIAGWQRQLARYWRIVSKGRPDTFDQWLYFQTYLPGKSTNTSRFTDDSPPDDGTLMRFYVDELFEMLEGRFGNLRGE
jgi:hypothetical protein